MTKTTVAKPNIFGAPSLETATKRATAIRKTNPALAEEIKQGKTKKAGALKAVADKYIKEQAAKKAPSASAPKQGKKAQATEQSGLQEKRFNDAAVDLEDFCKRYFDMAMWRDLVTKIEYQLHALGRHMDAPPPVGLKETVAILIEGYGFDAVSNEVLEHNT